MRTKRLDDIQNRWSQVFAERLFYPQGSAHWNELSAILKLINDEHMIGHKERHVMFWDGQKYNYRLED